MNTTRYIFLAALVGGLAGCVSPTPYQDARFGQSSAMLKAQQTLDPDAARNDDPVEGLDGKAAKSALDSYQERFRAPPAAAPSAFSAGAGGQ